MGRVPDVAREVLALGKARGKAYNYINLSFSLMATSSTANLIFRYKRWRIAGASLNEYKAIEF